MFKQEAQSPRSALTASPFVIKKHINSTTSLDHFSDKLFVLNIAPGLTICLFFLFDAHLRLLISFSFLLQAIRGQQFLCGCFLLHSYTPPVCFQPLSFVITAQTSISVDHDFDLLTSEWSMVLKQVLNCVYSGTNCMHKDLKFSLFFLCHCWSIWTLCFLHLGFLYFSFVTWIFYSGQGLFSFKMNQTLGIKTTHHLNIPQSKYLSFSTRVSTKIAHFLYYWSTPYTASGILLTAWSWKFPYPFSEQKI